ncbi:hypothetical protein AB6A23_03685 [Paenibacillus tarimensis]
MSFFTTWYFYTIYITLMVSFGVWYFFRLFVTRYFQAQKTSIAIEQKLLELKDIESPVQRFHEMNEWVQSRAADSIYFKECFEPSWRAFYKKFMEYQRNGVTFTPDVFDFFHEEIFIQKYGRRKLVDLIPGLFLAAGIIGTFLGIAAGVSGLDPDGNTTEMRSGIGLLLSGMKVKFLSSIIGIILSGLWQFIDRRSQYSRLVESFHKIRQGMDDTFPTQEESTVLFRMLENQEKHMLDFQAFMSEQLIPQMIGGFQESLNQTLLPTLEQTQTLMGELVQNASANQVEGVRQLTSEVMQSLNEITGEHMRNLGDALRATVEWQQRVHGELTELVESMQTAAGKQSEMVEKTTVLTEQIHAYTESITDYQEVLEQTVGQLNETSSKNSELQQAVTGLLEQMVEERNVFHEHFNEHMTTMRENASSITTQTQLQAEVQKELADNLELLTTMSEGQVELVRALIEQATASQKNGEELTQLIDRFDGSATKLVEIQNNVGGMLEGTSEERERLNNLIQKIQESLVEQVHLMDERTDALSSMWETTSDVMTQMNSKLTTSMSQFTDDMHRGLSRTFTQFDEELTKSITLLSKGVESMRDGLIDLPDVIEELKRSVQEINKLTRTATNG